MLDKATIDLIGKGIALAGLLFTAGTFAHGVVKDRADAKSAASLKLIEEYSTSGVRDHEIALLGKTLALQPYFSKLDDKILDEDDFKEAVLWVLFGSEEGFESTTRTGLLKEFHDILDFYSRANYCIEAELCDQVLIKSYFCDRAIAFDNKYRRTIEFWKGYTFTEEWDDGLVNLLVVCE